MPTALGVVMRVVLRRLDVKSRSERRFVRQPLHFVYDEMGRKVRTPEGKIPRVPVTDGESVGSTGKIL